MIKYLKIPLLIVACSMLYSCGTSGTLVVSHVAYQSVRTTDYKKEVPEDAKIAVLYSITERGELVVAVTNRTSEIMIIDQTMSFFVNTDYQSTSYYDPTVRVQSKTDMSSATKGASVNLGAIGNAFGVGGGLGAALSGINVGGSGTSGTATTNTTYFADQPKISLAPRSSGLMSKQFKIKGIGKSYLKNQNTNVIAKNEKDASTKFSVCISYSVDGGETYDKLVTDFYVNAQIMSPITGKGNVNDALRNIYSIKSDALYEPWSILYIVNNITTSYDRYDAVVNGVLLDCK